MNLLFIGVLDKSRPKGNQVPFILRSTLYSDLFLIPSNFCSTGESATKNVIFGFLTLDPLISTNIHYQLVPKIWRHAPGHCACCLPIISLRRYLHHLQIRHTIFTIKGRPCECTAAGTAAQSVVSDHHCIIFNFRKNGVT